LRLAWQKIESRPGLAAFLLGMLAAVALPPLYLVPVLFVAVAGLLRLIDAAPRAAAAFGRGFWFGFGHHLLGLYWVTEAILIEAARYWWFVPIAVPLLAATLAVFVGAATLVARLAGPGWPRLLTLAAAWTFADLAREFVATGFPWNPWGSVWELPGAAGDVMIQVASMVGVDGMTFATVLLAGLPTMGRRGWGAGAVLLAAWALFGVWRLAEPAPKPPGVTVILTQGNVAQGQKWDPAMAIDVFERYLALTRAGVEAASPGPKVVVWPESASPFLLASDANARAAIAAAADGAPVLAGSVRFEGSGLPRNSLVVVTPSGGVGGIYDKWHLVPFGEFQPSWIPLPVVVVPGGGFSQGPGPRTLHLPGLPPVGALICYEAIYTGEMVDEAARPAWLVNITNDAWFGNSTGPRQHLAAARLRAVEEGLPLMRAANTGITAAFDARGHELGRLPMRTADYMIVQLPGALPPTPYSRFGLLIPLALALVGVVVGLWERVLLLRLARAGL
jgi:apolipoprotein N-acyltransferase